jgi:steroid delta-isomerase-like uncharacterized protein
MKRYLVILLLTMLWSPAHAAERDYKREAALWYKAFSTKNTALLDKILADTWIDIPSNPRIPNGREEAKSLLIGLTTVFPDFNIVIQDILQDGDKVVVRSEITGTQRETFAGFLSKNRKIAIQAVDIHEFMDGKIVRTWHTEDWMTDFANWASLKNEVFPRAGNRRA